MQSIESDKKSIPSSTRTGAVQVRQRITSPHRIITASRFRPSLNRARSVIPRILNLNLPMPSEFRLSLKSTLHELRTRLLLFPHEPRPQMRRHELRRNQRRRRRQRRRTQRRRTHHRSGSGPALRSERNRIRFRIDFYRICELLRLRRRSGGRDRFLDFRFLRDGDRLRSWSGQNEHMSMDP